MTQSRPHQPTHHWPTLPLETVELAMGGSVWRVLAVRDQDALLDMADELAQIPYGYLLWESAVALANWLAGHAALVAGRRVLELGAGMGLPGLVAASLGAHVWQTDHEPQTLAIAAHNAEQNDVGGIQRFVADWRAWDHTDQYDLLLGADILYERAMHPHLELIFQRNLAPGGKLVLADPSRPQALELLARLEHQGWRFELFMHAVTLPLTTGAPKPVDVAILVGKPVGSTS
ncbi:MAG: methyltransferase domain-containing protein [Caldilineaceae bacterium]|nr:methyltransferase domain-containing protein [Caldilineaceae bacterium]